MSPIGSIEDDKKGVCDPEWGKQIDGQHNHGQESARRDSQLQGVRSGEVD